MVGTRNVGTERQERQRPRAGVAIEDAVVAPRTVRASSKVTTTSARMFALPGPRWAWTGATYGLARRSNDNLPPRATGRLST
jgi:hypothetical protein